MIWPAGCRPSTVGAADNLDGFGEGGWAVIKQQ